MFPRLPARAIFVAGHKSVLCPGHKNVPDFVQKHFVSATNVSQFAKPRKHHEQQCVRCNNVSSFASAFRIEKSRDKFLTSGKGNIGVYVISIAIALRWVYKPLTWTKKTVSFKIISGWSQFKSHVTSYSLLEKPIYLHLKFKKPCSRDSFR